MGFNYLKFSMLFNVHVRRISDDPAIRCWYMVWKFQTCMQRISGAIHIGNEDPHVRRVNSEHTSHHRKIWLLYMRHACSCND